MESRKTCVRPITHRPIHGYGGNSPGKTFITSKVKCKQLNRRQKCWRECGSFRCRSLTCLLETSEHNGEMVSGLLQQILGNQIPVSCKVLYDCNFTEESAAWSTTYLVKTLLVVCKMLIQGTGGTSGCQLLKKLSQWKHCRIYWDSKKYNWTKMDSIQVSNYWHQNKTEMYEWCHWMIFHKQCCDHDILIKIKWNKMKK